MKNNQSKYKKKACDLNQKILHYCFIGEKVVHFISDSFNTDFSESISELYFETNNNSLEESIQRHNGGEVINSDSLVASILWRFNGSESHSSIFH